MHEFDADTLTTPDGPGRFRGQITDRWDIGNIPNGGYGLCVGISALRQALQVPDPLTVTAHFLRPLGHGPVSIDVETVKSGRTLSTAAASMSQQGLENIRLLATFTDLDKRTGPTIRDGRPPEIGDTLATARPAGVAMASIGERIDTVFDDASMAWTRGETGATEIVGKLRFRDGRAPCTSSLVLFADAMPPPAFNALAAGWVPTLELTVHVRAKPCDGWVWTRFSTRFIQGGFLEEDGELWDEDGNLVAQSRQLAMMPR